MSPANVTSLEGREFSDARPWLVWGCAAFFFFFQFVVRVSPSVFLDDMLRDLQISACSAGAISGAYYLGYSNVQLFVGIILDRVGVRYPITGAASLIMIGCLIFSITDDFYLLSAARFLMGVGSALGFLSCVKTASMWFVSERLGLLIGLSILIGMSGATSGGYPMAYLVNLLGWRDSMKVLAIIAGTLGIITMTAVKDRKQPVCKQAQGQQAEMTIIQSLLILLKNKQTYLYALYGALMYAPLSGFADLWGVKYISMVYAVDRLHAAFAVSIIFIGIGASGPLLALAADRWRSYKKLMFSGSIISLVIYLAIIFIHLPTIEYTYPLFFLVGFVLGAQFFAFASVCEINPRQVSATASGLHNMLCMYGGGLSVYVIGYILDYVSDGSVDNNIAVYTIADFQIALLTIPICILLAVIIMLFVREAYPQIERKSS